MNRFVTILAAAAMICGAGCVNDGPTGPEVQDQLGRGIRGEGQLGPIDRSNDPYVRPREGAPGRD
ncbi:MAG: hypothetical protein ACR2ID_07695 [Chthoniobacterales bacterium]